MVVRLIVVAVYEAGCYVAKLDGHLQVAGQNRTLDAIALLILKCLKGVSALTLYRAAETDLVPTLLEFLDVQATTIAWQ